MPGAAIQPAAILYGASGPRGASTVGSPGDHSLAALLPTQIDTEQLDLNLRYKFRLGNGSWTGAGGNWVVKMAVLPDSNNDLPAEWVRDLSAPGQRAQRLANHKLKYLTYLEDYLETQKITAEEMSAVIDDFYNYDTEPVQIYFQQQSHLDDKLYEYGVPAHQLKAVELLAATVDGQWRLLDWELIDSSYQELIYVAADGSIQGSVSTDKSLDQ